MHCKNCGKEIPTGAQFCVACGAGIDGTMPAGAAVPAEDQKYIKGWSWGGFFGGWIFLFVHKQKSLAWKLFGLFVVAFVVAWTPFVFGILSRGLSVFSMLLSITILAVMVWLGIRARKMVWDSGVYTTVAEMKKRQRLATKLTILYFVLIIVLSMVLGILTAMKYAAQQSAHPQAVNQSLMLQALQNAKTKNPTIVDAEFNAGYVEGSIYGPDNTKTTALATTATNSYKLGYGYGFTIECLQKYNDEQACSTRVMKALGLSK
jgi:hypothetical protein